MAFSSSTMFDFELTRILGSTPSGGCDVGEFKTAVGRIKNHDAESWFAAWDAEGSRAEKVGNEAAKAGFKAPARNAYLRASNYYRAASYMFNNADPRVVPYCQKSIDVFRRATTLMAGEVLCVEIPYEKDVTLPGYLCLPAKNDRVPGKIPIVIFANGADAPKEESYFLYGHHGPQSGYAVLCFDGPGQGLLLKQKQLPLRTDFEAVVSKTLDFLGDLSDRRPELELDMDRVAVSGAVTGGYYALRAATDPRTKACVAVDPVYSMWELAISRAPQTFVSMWENGWVPDSLFDFCTEAFTKTNFQASWEMGMMKSGMGVTKPTAMLRRFKEFSLEPEKSEDALKKITCPVLLTAPGHGKEMYSSANDGALKIERMLVNVPEGKKEVWIPTEIAEGGLTAKIGAWPLLSQKTFMFLDGCFSIERKALNTDVVK